jgi:hypothetical protein
LDEAPPAPAEPTPEPERATTFGVYRNGMAIPLERYVAIMNNGTTRRFRTSDDAVAFLGLLDEGEVTIRNYHVPHEVVETWYSEEVDDEEYDSDDDY